MHINIVPDLDLFPAILGVEVYGVPGVDDKRGSRRHWVDGKAASEYAGSRQGRTRDPAAKYDEYSTIHVAAQEGLIT